MFHGRTMMCRAGWCALSLSLLLDPSALASDVLHVDDDAPPGGDGTSWSTAFRFLADAVGAAAGGTVEEIRVAQGTYVPDRSDAFPAGTGDRAATFTLLDDVSLNGGYAGLGAPDPDQRDVTLFVTMLSGDLAGDDGPEFANNGENSRHVVTAPNGTAATAILAGCTITAGHAEGATNDERSGGGLYIDISSSPTILDCTFASNAAELFGGGIYSKSSPATAPTVKQCLFTGNDAGQGGGMFNSGSRPRVTCCRFLDNTAGTGAGITNFNGSGAAITNCLFAGNAARDNGGAMSNFLNGRPTISSCTIVDNTAGSNGGGTYNNSDGRPHINNTILWGNADAGGSDASAQIYVGNGDPIVKFSFVQGGWTGSGGDNHDLDPLFADADGPDEDPDTVADNDYRLGAGSPCIDAGRSWSSPPDVTDEDQDGDVAELIPVDLPGDARFADEMSTPDTGCGNPTVIDTGAFEATGQSMNPMRIGDTNGDGMVGFADVLNVIGQWGPCDGCCVGDLDGNGNVGFQDILMMIANWG
ncbi:MAG: right-handed parallel beta-helix repeat-containing protein [Planctomycetes bacterium]|nr:right-handed parallel beta-helix repeat-containing protein [Planctomycetota bacterium]